MAQVDKNGPYVPITDNHEPCRKNQNRENCSAASRRWTPDSPDEQAGQDRSLDRLDRVVVGHLAQCGERRVVFLARLIVHL